MRDNQISIMKGIAIILMVIGHSGCPQLLDSFMYLFHMPLFFFVSGWFFSESYADDKLLFIKKRIMGLYWPFVKYGLLFLALHNTFYDLNISSNSYNVSQLLNNAMLTVSFRGVDALLGGFWFLKYLFVASIICLFGVYFITRLYKYRSLINGYIFLTLFFGVLALIVCYLGYNAGYVFSCILFMIGYLSKIYRNLISTRLIIALPLSLVLFVVAYVKPMSMHGACDSIFLIVPYLFISSIGIYFVMIISHYFISTKINKLLIYIGDNTLCILVYHMLALKIVSLLKIWQYQLPITSLSCFPVIKEHNTYYWILYSFVGIAVPLIMNYILKSIKLTLNDFTPNWKVIIKSKYLNNF